MSPPPLPYLWASGRSSLPPRLSAAFSRLLRLGHTHPRLAPLWWRGIGLFGTGFFELSRAYEVEGGVAPNGIVEPVNVAANGLVGFLAGVEDGPPDQLGFQGLEERFHHGVVVAISLAGH